MDTNSIEVQKLINDKAHERLLDHISLLRAAGQITKNQRLAAVDATYQAFDDHNTPEQTYTILCNQAKRYGLDLTSQAVSA